MGTGEPRPRPRRDPAPTLRVRARVWASALCALKKGPSRGRSPPPSPPLDAGASYADVKAQLPALEVLFWVALICARLFFWGARRGGIAVPLFSIVLLAGVSLIIGGIIPPGFPRRPVEPPGVPGARRS